MSKLQVADLVVLVMLVAGVVAGQRDAPDVAPEITVEPAALYLALGDAEGSEMRGAFERAGEILAAAPPSLRWQADVTPHADHGSAPRRATPAALRFWHAGG